MSTGTLATEGRAAKIEVVDLDFTDNGLMAATLVPYNEPADIGFFTEAFLPGSLAKSISEAARSLPLHVFHDDMPGMSNTESWPIGVATEWQDTDQALRGVWKFDSSEKAQRARQLATPDEDGNSMLGYMSLRFSPIRDKWRYAQQWDPSTPEGKDHVDRVEARLVSAGLVTTPAYVAATVDWVRSAGAPGRDTGRRAVDEWAEYLAKVKAGPVG